MRIFPIAKEPKVKDKKAACEKDFCDIAKAAKAPAPIRPIAKKNAPLICHLKFFKVLASFFQN